MLGRKQQEGAAAGDPGSTGEAETLEDAKMAMALWSTPLARSKAVSQTWPQWYMLGTELLNNGIQCA